MDAFLHLKTETEAASEMLYFKKQTKDKVQKKDNFFSKSYTIGRALSN